jgi:hypothetical protein
MDERTTLADDEIVGSQGGIRAEMTDDADMDDSDADSDDSDADSDDADADADDTDA